MSIRTVSAESLIEQQVTKKCCKLSYKPRWFYSRGAVCVLVWNFLTSAACGSSFILYTTLLKGLNAENNAGQYSKLGLVVILPFIVFAPLAGWLADSRCGNYKVFKAGSLLVFIAVIIACLCTLLLENCYKTNPLLCFVISAVLVPIMYALGFVGAIAWLVTSLQLGLDQMPEASSANVSSFVSWFVFSLFGGMWFSGAFTTLFVCTNDTFWETVVVQVFSLFPVGCMCLVCCSIFLIAPKWLTIEPKSPQSLKTIYQVLKFAAKHKTPINRSAFTYWEEDIPSRIDLGKSRYGGPFTTEQVEDVKTFFKLLIIFLPVLIISLALNFSSIIVLMPGLNSCESAALFSVTYNPSWCVVAGVLIYELGIYPVICNQLLPSILKRIGVVAFLVLLLNCVYLILSVISFRYSINFTYSSDIVYPILCGFATMFLATGSYEFVCAQSPYSMRGLLAGYSTFIYITALSLGAILFVLFQKGICVEPYCLVVQYSLITVFSLIGFVLHCVLARWYQMRMRDDIYAPQRLIEEVYDRYLSHGQ